MNIAIDRCHRELIRGLVMSAKPRKLLEIGIGTGLTTDVLRAAIAHNGRGELHCVDNLFDWNGVIPEHIRELQKTVQVTICDEGEFLCTAPTAEWDFIVSDGDHFRAHEYVKDYCRILRRGGILAIHDTKNSEFPNLGTIREQLDGFMKMEFSESTRDDEHCERGLLIAKKPEDAPANSGRTFVGGWRDSFVPS